MLVNKVKITDIINNGTLNIPLNTQFIPETEKNIESVFNLDNLDVINNYYDYEKIPLYPASYNTKNISDGIYFRLHLINNGNWDIDTSSLSVAGFVEDDIKLKRKRIGKSFIRLSFYDSKDLKTQNLLFYSTIFLDADELYSKYISLLDFTELSLDFIAENPKLSRKIKSFEGYRLYIFKSDLSIDKKIYMRVDFNNASNGKSILLTKSKPLNNNGFTMEELVNNMFMEINCTKNNGKNIYTIENVNTSVYNNTNDSKIKNIMYIDLFQSKVI